MELMVKPKSQPVVHGFKYRFYPTAEQERLLLKTVGCTRLVYNLALNGRHDAWAAGVRIDYADQSEELADFKAKAEMDFLNEVSCVPLQQVLRHLHSAFVNFWEGRARLPTFKKKRNGGSAEFTRSAFKFEDGQLTLAKMSEPLDIVWSRPLPAGARPTTVSVSVDAAGRWHVSLTCEDPDIQPLPKLTTAVGLDLGITDLLTLSTGEKIPNPKHHVTEAARMRRLARDVARKEKGSKNREKAKLRLAQWHATIADRRRDHLQKLSTRLVRENQVIVVEDLNVAGMLHNRCLAKAISGCGWSELIRQLAYKCEWYGRTLLKVSRWLPSSKLCSDCGFKRDKLPLSVRTWSCPQCGAEHDRDTNAARNILAAGLAVAQSSDVCGLGIRQRVLRGSLHPGLKQKLHGVTCGIPSL